MLTSIQVRGLQVFAYHGLFEEERRLGQKFTLDICARLRVAQSHTDDRLLVSIRYDELVDAALTAAKDRTFHTLETLGESIARQLLRQFLLVESITIVIGKTSPPIAATLQQVGVEIHLTRAELSTSADDPPGMGSLDS